MTPAAGSMLPESSTVDSPLVDLPAVSPSSCPRSFTGAGLFGPVADVGSVLSVGVGSRGPSESATWPVESVTSTRGVGNGARWSR